MIFYSFIFTTFVHPLSSHPTPQFRASCSFGRVYERRHPAGETEAGAPCRRAEGGGRKSVLTRAEDKLLFILTYVKTYPLQVVMGGCSG